MVLERLQAFKKNPRFEREETQFAINQAERMMADASIIDPGDDPNYLLNRLDAAKKDPRNFGALQQFALSEIEQLLAAAGVIKSKLKSYTRDIMIGNIVRNALVEKSLNQLDLAKMAKVQQSLISRLVNGTSQIRRENLSKVGDALGIDLISLLEGRRTLSDKPLSQDSPV